MTAVQLKDNGGEIVAASRHNRRGQITMEGQIQVRNLGNYKETS